MDRVSSQRVGAADVVFIPPHLTHAELIWTTSFAPALRRFSSFCRLIRFDKRGTGMSDRVSGAPTLETRMDDARAVMDAVGCRRAAFFGSSEGAAMSLLFAATYPERTAALVLRSAYPRTMWAPDYPWGRTEDDYRRELDRELGLYRSRREALESVLSHGLRFENDEEAQQWIASFSVARRMSADLPELIVEDAAAWAAWLARRHATSDGVWLALAKQGGHPPTRLRYQEALEEALCYGWIDGQVRRFDADSYRQRFTPRRKRSAWSKRNVDIAERLIGEGRMKPAGRAAIERARSDGRWQAAYAGSATIEIPGDLAEALAAEPRAEAMFAHLTSQNRYAILYRLATAKRSDTRSRRLAKFVEMLARGETIYPQQRRPG